MCSRTEERLEAFVMTGTQTHTPRLTELSPKLSSTTLVFFTLERKGREDSVSRTIWRARSTSVP